MKVYIVVNELGIPHEENVYSIEAVYTNEEDANEHLKIIYDKLIMYCSENDFEKPRMCDGLVLTGDAYEYDRWRIITMDVSNAPKRSEIEP